MNDIARYLRRPCPRHTGEIEGDCPKCALHEERLRLVREGHPAVQDGPYAYIQQDGYMAGEGITRRDAAPSLVGRIVARATDDSPCPLTGRVTGQVDEDRVEVAWGDAQYSETARPSTEWIDELRPVRA